MKKAISPQYIVNNHPSAKLKFVPFIFFFILPGTQPLSATTKKEQAAAQPQAKTSKSTQAQQSKSPTIDTTRIDKQLIRFMDKEEKVLWQGELLMTRSIESSEMPAEGAWNKDKKHTKEKKIYQGNPWGEPSSFLTFQHDPRYSEWTMQVKHPIKFGI